MLLVRHQKSLPPVHLGQFRVGLFACHRFSDTFNLVNSFSVSFFGFTVCPVAGSDMYGLGGGQLELGGLRMAQTIDDFVARNDGVPLPHGSL